MTNENERIIEVTKQSEPRNTKRNAILNLMRINNFRLKRYRIWYAGGHDPIVEAYIVDPEHEDREIMVIAEVWRDYTQ
ncbi:MAG: hypothetical protein QXZ17_16165, partial [Nitrososphaerota archaeon]